MKANNKQQEAITHTKGPLLIIAGAGSGKTATLTQRVQYMISEEGIAPGNILALTFTNKAASEMKDRIGGAIGSQYHPHMSRNRHLPYIGTFHSFGIYILKDILSATFPTGLSSEEISEMIGIKKDFIIYDESDKLSVMKGIIKDDMGLIEKEFPPRQIAYYISDAKNKLLNAKQYTNQADTHFKAVVAKAFELYEKKLRENNAMDFDDILLKLLATFCIPQVKDFYQEKYTYIMIDEYQDTNLIQYEIVNLLAEKYQNIAVVGDDAQSIYSWRGADMRNILSFKKDYPSALVVKLEQNYRSTKNILAGANHVIKNNTESLEKNLWTENTEGEKIQIVENSDDRSEASTIAENIKDYVNTSPSASLLRGEGSTRKYSDNLILYRTNAQSRSIEEGLLKHAIPYKVIGGMKFYDRKEIKDILAYLRLIHNSSDPVSFLRIINTPSRKIGAKSLEMLSSFRNSFGISFIDVLESIDDIKDLRPAAKEALKGFYETFCILSEYSRTHSVSQLISEVIKRVGYQEYLRTQFSEVEYESKKENLSELGNVASEYSGLEPRESLSLFLEEVALISDLDNLTSNPSLSQESGALKEEDRGFVTLMTIHTSKGLEEKRVFVAGLEDGLFPHSRTQNNPSELEEERRLMYVAMTRAKEELFLSYAKERLYFGDYVRNPVSRFLGEIPEEYTESQENASNSFSGFSFAPLSSKERGWGGDIKNHEERGVPVGREIVQNDVSLFRVGSQVEHPRFGVGVIDSMIGEIAEIRFREGVKKMNIRIAPVKCIS